MSSQEGTLKNERNNYLFLFIICISGFAFSQSKEKIISGKIIAEGTLVSGIDVVNLVNEESVLTNEKGEFKILAKTDDLLVFSSARFEYKRKIVEKEDFESGIIAVEMVPKPGQLEEVVIIKYKDIKLEDVGISPARKHFTPAERRLYTAGDFKPIHLLSILGGSMPFDPILNAINGRTKRLKKEVDLERTLFRFEKIDNLYNDEFYADKLKIPTDYIQGFKYFLAEDEKLAVLFESENKSSIELYVVKLSENYIKLIADNRD